jgi:lactate dehydrogenase-like 2-hydroxyacid dehydrogenase
MAKPKLLVTRKLPDPVEERARRDYEAAFNAADSAYGRDEIARRANGMDAILCTVGDDFSAAAIAQLPESVRILTTFSVGYDHIDVAAAQRRGLAVANTPDVLTPATADITILCLLGAARRASEGERLIREDKWTGWAPTQLMGTEVSGKRLGILGMGRIGQAVARRARGFEMEIHYSDAVRRDLPSDLPATFHADPNEMLPLCQFLSLHVPLLPETKGWLNAARIARLPKGAIVVNSSRGPVIDDAALIAALRSGHLAAAGLDVFTGEPKLDPGYRALPNTFLLPHLGSATHETRAAMGFRALDNLDAFFAGRALLDPVTAA